MLFKGKSALVVNLTKQTAEVKSFIELHKYIGGIGLGLKLYQLYGDQDPLIFSVGPLNGYFPFASKTSVVLCNSGVIEDLYLGGSLSTRIKYCGLDSIVLIGKAKSEVILNVANTQVTFKKALTDRDSLIDSLGLPGKRSVIQNNLLDNYFATSENYLGKKLLDKNVLGMVITGTETTNIQDPERYQELFHQILSQKDLLSVRPGLFPSCALCPMGCEKSKTGEIGGNVIVHSLVACEYAEKIYSDTGVAFSCLNLLGYDYTHEDIESLPELIQETLKKLA